LPVVHRTGGLADTVVDAAPENVAAGRATGFSFAPHTKEAFADALRRCLAMYRDDPATWRKVQQTAMAQDWSWRRSAAEYERLYRRALAE
ncbi:MAG: glycogen synthase GlgA, partial [Planctomycetes bacterium]|nr:glycogen synthase GlgA [Planctomycetota bacterium]